MSTESTQNLRGGSIASFWMLVPTFLTASPLLFPSAILPMLWWMLGIVSCVIIPIVAAVVHRCRGIGYLCGSIGAVLIVLLAPFVLFAYFVSHSV